MRRREEPPKANRTRLRKPHSWSAAALTLFRPMCVRNRVCYFLVLVCRSMPQSCEGGAEGTAYVQTGNRDTEGAWTKLVLPYTRHQARTAAHSPVCWTRKTHSWERESQRTPPATQRSSAPHPIAAPPPRPAGAEPVAGRAPVRYSVRRVDFGARPPVTHGSTTKNMDDTSTLGDGSLFTTATLPHDILPQLPGYRTNHQIQHRKKASLKSVPSNHPLPQPPRATLLSPTTSRHPTHRPTPTPTHSLTHSLTHTPSHTAPTHTAQVRGGNGVRRG